MIIALLLVRAASAGDVGLEAGLHVGPAVTLSPLSTGVLPRLEVGAMLPFADRRVTVFATGAYLAAHADGTVEDSRVPGGSWSYTLHQSETIVGGGLTARFLPWTAPINGEVSVAPVAFLYGSKIDGAASDSAFPRSTEKLGHAGVLADAAVDFRLGPGVLTVGVEYMTAALDGTIQGDSTAAAVTPSVGFRVHVPSFEAASHGGTATTTAAADDKDGDGVKDAEDTCPDAKGPAATGGCPDADGDGTVDSDDKCPTTPGPVSSYGCPADGATSAPAPAAAPAPAPAPAPGPGPAPAPAPAPGPAPK